MNNIKGSSAAIYSAVGNQKLSNGNLDGYDHWNGQSLYIEDNQANLENGRLYQVVSGANKNEIWLFSLQGKGELKVILSFIDYNDNIISSSSEKFTTDSKQYLSSYGVAPAKANKVMVRVEGNGQVENPKLKHLKPLAMISDWEGSLKTEKSRTFEGSASKLKFVGQGESIRFLDGMSLNRFDLKEKIFVGFLSDKSLFNRVEGRITHINNAREQSPGSVKFECSPVKIPFRDWS